MDYKNRYLKYKDKYINLRINLVLDQIYNINQTGSSNINQTDGSNINQTGGFNINYIFGAIVLTIIIVIFKRLNQCPIEEKGYRDPKTGILRWRGKEDVINDIKEWFDTPKIKDNEAFKNLLKQEKITIGEIKSVLNKIKFKDVSHIIRSIFKNYGDSTTRTQKNIDNIITNIDCVCATSQIYTNNDIVNPKCLEGLKIDKYDKTINDIKLNTNCKEIKINKKINSFDNATLNISFPEGENCLKPETQNDYFLNNESDLNIIQQENNALVKILAKLI